MMLLVGGPARWFSNFALVRLQQGKSLLVTACVPLLIAYAVEYVCRPSIPGWIRLAAAQIAAMGFSSTALWLAPTVVGLAAISAIPPSPRVRWKTLILAAASSFYVLAAGLAVRAAMEGYPQIPGLQVAPDRPLLSSFEIVFGDGLLRTACLAVLLLGWYFCPTIVSERLCTVYPLGALLTVLNPFLAKSIAANVVGGLTFFRVLWILPLPMFIAIALAAPMTGGRGRRLGLLRPIGYVTGILLLLMVVAPCMTFSRQNVAEVRWPGKKVPAEYAVAARIVQIAPPRSYVLAPEEVALWVPTFHRHPYPLVTRTLYAFLLDSTRPGESGRRLALEAYVSGKTRTDLEAKLFVEALRGGELELVCLRRSTAWRAEMVAALEAAGFVRADGDSQYDLWVRKRFRSAYGLPERNPWPASHLARAGSGAAARQIDSPNASLEPTPAALE
jgi:hypothetical protein